VEARKFFLFCGADGLCVLKEEGKPTIREFSGIPQALDFLRDMYPQRGTTLTIYDPKGNVTFKDLY
jgi:hypothetical protein